MFVGTYLVKGIVGVAIKKSNYSRYKKNPCYEDFGKDIHWDAH